MLGLVVVAVCWEAEVCVDGEDVKSRKRPIVAALSTSIKEPLLARFVSPSFPEEMVILSITLNMYFIALLFMALPPENLACSYACLSSCSAYSLTGK